MTSQPLYQDPSRSSADRAGDLLSRMTLDEKIAQLGSYWVYQIMDGMAFSPEKASTLLKHGLGHVTRLGGASNLHPQELAALANQIQSFLLESTRLSIPAIIHEECCSGYMARGATVFPQAIGVASAWQPELVEAMADVIRKQMRSVGAHHTLSPLLDVARDARWGRTEETYGEDPYLTSQMGVAYVRGIQGKRLSEGVVATGKHFVGYGASEGGLNWAPPHLSWRDLRETYLVPFEAAVRAGGMASMMNAYNELDGIPAASSKALLTDLLRGEWGFKGTVISDYFAVNMLKDYHRVATDKADAAHLALDAGMDMELPFTDCFGEPLREAVTQRRIDIGLVDRAVLRVLTQKFEVGVFENPFVDASVVVFDTPEERGLARTIAQKSIVLLKNEGNLLPLDKGVKSIAVIGPNADSVRNLFGDYSYPSHMETLLENFTKANVFNMPLPEGLHEVSDFVNAVSVLTAINAKVGAGTQVEYAKGCEVNSPDTSGFAEAVEAARRAQIAVVVVGDKAGLTDDCTSGEARDRAVLTLPGVQSELVRAVYETGTPVVLVLVNGRPVALEWIAEAVPAIVEAWFPSEEGANAIADVLFGDVNPGGKLPITFPRTAGQIPVFYAHKPSGGRSNWKGDYVDTPVKPLYPFGYGLSYTQFEYSAFQIEQAGAQAGEHVTIHVNVTNTGERSGDEVVQLYVHQNVRLVTRPVKELKAFKRITLEPRETQTVTFTLAVNQLGFYDLNQEFVVEPGTVDVMIGSSSQDIHCTGTFEITGARTDVSANKVFFSGALAAKT